MKVIALILSVFLLVACEGEKRSTQKMVLQETVKMEVTYIRRPKHFWITLREVDTGIVHEHSTKHCAKHHLYTKGGVYDFYVRHYEVTRPVPTNDLDVKIRKYKEISIC